MFRNYLVTALRNLARNRLYALINIVGLSVGLSAVLLIALFVRDDFNYDTWIPGHERVYHVNFGFALNDSEIRESGATTILLAAELLTEFPNIQTVARMEPRVATGVRSGNLEANESIAFADPTFFAVLPMPAFRGDLATALVPPDGLVLTRRIARKYFGTDEALGQTLEINREHTVRVTAVLEDMPSNTHLSREIFISSRASYSGIADAEAQPPDRVRNQSFSDTYIRLVPGARISAVDAGMPVFMKRFYPGNERTFFRFVPLKEVHLTAGIWGQKPPGNRQTDYALLAVASLILLGASINFINLMVARASRRATEVGVRKTAGALRLHLAIQFIGETGIYVSAALAIGTILAASLLPSFSGFLERDIGMEFKNWFLLVGSVAATAAILSALAGSYPAFVLSSFRPAVVLKANTAQGSETGRVRQWLVIMQFAILIGLTLATAVIYRQSDYAVREGLRLQSEQILMVRGDETALMKGKEPVPERFRNLIRGIPGVSAAAASLMSPSTDGSSTSGVSTTDGRKVGLRFDVVEPGFFELYGLTPRAGRFFDASRASDDAAQYSDSNSTNVPIVINETAVQVLGFASPEAAVGQTLSWERRSDWATRADTNRLPSEIIGVVPDFVMDSIRRQIDPAFFYVDKRVFFRLSVKLSGQNIPEALTAIDRAWLDAGGTRPAQRQFVSQVTQELYLDITRQSQVLAAFTGVAIFIACLGLLGLAAFAAETRTREIGIRKAMGANTIDLLRLLTWQFTKPVLWANVIAWPVGYIAMRRWLDGFAYHIDLSPWIFLAASLAAVGIAVLTVMGQVLLVARAQPVKALRHE